MVTQLSFGDRKKGGMMSSTLDLLIIGGGPAGLAAALLAGRARLRTVVVDADSPRNGVTKASHGLFTRDGASPQEIREAGKQQLEKYTTVQYHKARIESLERLPEGFRASTLDQAWQAKRVLVATGWKDVLERIHLPGIQEVYGRSVFPCPFCDGFELSHKRLAIFLGDMPTHMLQHYFAMVSVLSSPEFMVFTNGRTLEPELQEALKAKNIPVVESRIAELVSRDGILQAVHTKDGRQIARDAGFVLDHFMVPSTHFARQLGIAIVTDPRGLELPEAKEDGSTSVPGFYLAGDARMGFGGLTIAASQGALCVTNIIRDIAMERWHGR